MAVNVILTSCSFDDVVCGYVTKFELGDHLILRSPSTLESVTGSSPGLLATSNRVTSANFDPGDTMI